MPNLLRCVACWFLLVSCRSKPPMEAPRCTPTEHPLVRLGPPFFEGFSWLGAAADGQRVAYAVSHLGPGSGKTVGGAHVVQAHASKELWGHSFFDVQSEDAGALATVEEGITLTMNGELAARGIELGHDLPHPQKWCADGQRIITEHGALELKVSHTPCADTPTRKAVSWEVCAGSRCTQFASTGCLDGEVTVHDAARVGDVDWVVVDVVTKPFGDLDFHLFQVAGISNP